MLTFILAALFCVIGLLTALSLADSAMRWRNAWRSLRHELNEQMPLDPANLRADVIAFSDVRPSHHSAWQRIPANSNGQFDVAA